MLQRLGIEAIYVFNEDDRGWNIVRCNGKYYHMDTAWGTNDIEDTPKSELPAGVQYAYEYLCFTDIKMYANYGQMYDIIDAEPPKCDSWDLNYYELNNMYYEEYSSKVRRSIKKSINSGKQYWRCQFNTKKEYQKCLKKIKNGLYGNELEEYFGEDTMDWWYIHDDMYVICCWYEI